MNSRTDYNRQPISPQRIVHLMLSVREERGSHGQIEWRGRLVDPAKGESITFEDWPELIDQIAEALHRLRPRPAACGWEPVVGLGLGLGYSQVIARRIDLAE